MRVLKIRELPHTLHDDAQLRDATIRTKGHNGRRALIVTGSGWRTVGPWISPGTVPADGVGSSTVPTIRSQDSMECRELRSPSSAEAPVAGARRVLSEDSRIHLDRVRKKLDEWAL